MGEAPEVTPQRRPASRHGHTGGKGIPPAGTAGLLAISQGQKMGRDWPGGGKGGSRQSQEKWDPEKKSETALMMLIPCTFLSKIELRLLVLRLLM